MNDSTLTNTQVDDVMPDNFPKFNIHFGFETSTYLYFGVNVWKDYFDGKFWIIKVKPSELNN